MIPARGRVPWEPRAGNPAARPRFNSAVTGSPITAAAGSGSRPARARSSAARTCITSSKAPARARRKNQRYTVVTGGNSCGRCVHAQPVRSTYWMPSSTCRTGHAQGRPTLAGAGMNGATTAHSASVRLVA